MKMPGFATRSFLPLTVAVCTELLFALQPVALAQEARYFRISGPTNTAILEFHPTGEMVWSNAQPGATFTVQTASTLAGGTNWVDYVQLPTSNSVSTNQLVNFHPPAGMAFIPMGSFTMGDTLDGNIFGDATPTNATVSAFYMDSNLVTYSAWQSVFALATNQGYHFDSPGSGKASNHPVQTVNWYDVVKWCNARSQLSGLTPVYYTDMALTQVYKTGDIVSIFPNWAANGFRLPTEAEWEKAARGGLIGKRFPWGDTISRSQADYQGNTNSFTYDLGPNGYNPVLTNGGTPYTSAVGSYAPNGYGLFDMAGNLFEWCWDRYGTNYSGGMDPRGPASGSFRVLRSGYWDNYADQSRCANRINHDPVGAFYSFGFRCVRGR